MEHEPASGAMGIPADQFVDGHSVDLVGETSSEAEMETADRVRVDVDSVGERAVGKDVLERIPAPPRLGIESPPGRWPLAARPIDPPPIPVSAPLILARPDDRPPRRSNRRRSCQSGAC